MVFKKIGLGAQDNTQKCQNACIAIKNFFTNLLS